MRLQHGEFRCIEKRFMLRLADRAGQILIQPFHHHEDKMNFFISRLFFPMAVLGSFAIFLMVRNSGGNLEIAIFLPSIAIMLLALYLERKTPFLAA
jgi:hypothetical protein